MTEMGTLYRDNLDALSALAGDLDEDDIQLTVPASPAWTIHDVLAHLAGGACDVATGRMDGAPLPEWTARHVSERIGFSPTDLIAELESHADTILARLEDATTPAFAFDLAVHHADLHEALGRHSPPEHLWVPVLHAIAPRMLGELPITVYADNAAFGAGGPEVQAVPYELFRALFSRRSRSQLAAWDWPLDAAQLDSLAIFGPRDDDQPLPDRPAGPPE